MKPFNFDVRIIAVIAVVVMFGIFAFVNSTKSTKPSLEDKLTQLKELRADKVAHQKAIYLDDQKIVPLKCSIYSDVGAKDQWNIECQDFFQEQQTKILNKSQIESEVSSMDQDFINQEAQ